MLVRLARNHANENVFIRNVKSCAQIVVTWSPAKKDAAEMWLLVNTFALGCVVSFVFVPSVTKSKFCKRLEKQGKK